MNRLHRRLVASSALLVALSSALVVDAYTGASATSGAPITTTQSRQLLGSGEPTWQLPFPNGSAWQAGGPHPMDGVSAKTKNSLDFGPRGGTTRVVAMASGTVYRTACGDLGINHGGGWRSTYTHMNNQQTNLVGKRVSAGTYLGTAGRVLRCGGYASFDHVHVAITKDGSPVSVSGRKFGKYRVHSSGGNYYGYWTDSSGRRVVTASGAAACCLTSTTKKLPTATKPRLTASAPRSATLVGSAYAYQFKASGNPKPTFRKHSGTLPPGLTLTKTGRLSGRATRAGTFSFRVQAKSSAGTSTSATRSIKVSYALAPTGGQSATSDGYMFTTFVGADGQLHYAARGESDNAWREWRTRQSPTGVLLTGKPWAINAAGHLFVFATGDDGSVHYAARDAAADEWNDWRSLTAPDGVQFVGSPSAVVSAGYLFVTAIGDDGHVYTQARHATAGWLGWIDRDAPSVSGLQGSPTIAVSDEYMFVVVIDRDGVLHTRARSEVDGKWRAWTVRGNPAGVPLTGTAAAVHYDGYLFVLAVGADGELYTIARPVRSSWLEWQRRSHPTQTLLTSSPSVALSGGYMFVGVVGVDGSLYTKARDASTNDWNDWNDRGAPTGEVLTGDPALTTNDRNLFMHASSSSGKLYTRARGETSGDTSGWRDGGSPSGVEVHWLP